MRTTFLPSADAALLAWSANFSAKLSATPAAYGMTAAQATQYATAHAAFVTAMAAVDPAIRTRVSVATKNQARLNLKTLASSFGRTISANLTVTNPQKIELGLSVRGQPQPIPAPSNAPMLEVISVSGVTAKIRLHDSAAGSKRGMPAGVYGASVFSFTGPTAPGDIAAWKFEGNTGRVINEIVFPSSTTAGAKVWFTAFWFNGRKQSGPVCAPVSTNLPGGSVSLAA